MEGMLTFFNLVFLGAAIALITIVIWAPRRFYVKVVSFALALLLVGVSYLSLMDLLGRPKPIALEWEYKDLKEAVVIDAVSVEGKAVYLWLQLPDVEEPRYYVMPWIEGENQEGSEGNKGESDSPKGPGEQLQDALRKREEANDGSQVIITNPFQGGLETRDREEKFYIKLPPKPRPKDPPEKGPEVFEHPGTEF